MLNYKNDISKLLSIGVELSVIKDKYLQLYLEENHKSKDYLRQKSIIISILGIVVLLSFNLFIFFKSNTNKQFYHDYL